jgi:cyclopropane-fatty-acyl-phospholipid synthase
MTSGQISPDSPLQGRAPRPHLRPAYARLALKVMQRLSVGSLTVTLPDGSAVCVGKGEPHAEMALVNWNVAKAAMRNGDIGFGETYIAGDWSTPNLSQLMHVMVSNRTAITDVIYGQWWGKILYRARHLLRRNTRSGSRRNIEAHYDIGNSFYQLWLDPGMTYSSALFPAGESEADDARLLAAGQVAKCRRILDELALAPGQSVLEIGCGWGSMAEMAARDRLSVTAVTLSAEQLEFARARLANQGLASRTELRLQDYRDCQGQFDAIVSIEMFEAVGEKFWPAYFATLKRCLKPGGRAVVQSITIDERLFEDYRKGSDFIQQYIFPGGMLPSTERFCAAARGAGLKITATFAFGQDYARTLRIWTRNFQAREREVRALGFDTAFLRTWQFYLAYCEAAFRCANTDVIQFTLEHAS